MAAREAFVGHSFTADDDEIVKVFLGYFTQLAEAVPDFAWRHAEKAEPAELADKVMRLISECNVFIGICTKKEMVARKANIVTRRWLRPYRILVPENLEWKTSDWVIQEIGLAVGRGMSLIILLEDGCRKPAGLSGDLEYISFTRSRPEKAFGKLLEMVRALPSASRAGSAPAPIGDAVADRDNIVALTPVERTGEDDPDPTWDENRYRIAVLMAIASKDTGREARIDLAFRSTPLAETAGAIGAWEAHKESWRVDWGVGGDLSRLKNLHLSHPGNGSVTANYARVLSKIGDNKKAAELYLLASTESDDDEVVVRRKSQSMVSFVRAQQEQDAKLVLHELRELVSIGRAPSSALAEAIRDYAEASKDSLLELQALEAVVALTPEDTAYRFSLAFKHSEAGNREMALFHYRSIPSSLRQPMTWNNLGVVYQEEGLQGKAVAAFQFAAEEKETLAMSNLAYKLMNAGFFSEAEDRFTLAMKESDFHANNADGLAELRRKPESEDNKETELLEKSAGKRVFWAKLADAILETKTMVLARDWKSPISYLSATLSADQFVATGRYEAAQNALISVLSPSSQPPRPRTITYKGTIFGRRISGDVIRDDDPVQKGLLDPLSRSTNEFQAVVSQDGAHIDVMESPQSTFPTFYRIDRIQMLQAPDK